MAYGASIGPESIIKQMADLTLMMNRTNHFIQLALASVLANKEDGGNIIERLKKEEI